MDFMRTVGVYGVRWETVGVFGVTEQKMGVFGFPVLQVTGCVEGCLGNSKALWRDVGVRKIPPAKSAAE